MALGASLSGFRTAIRPVIAIDGTFLKGAYRGTMFVAAALDGNDQIYPVAFGVGDSENDASWEWFLEKLRDALGSISNLVFVSDRHDSIVKGIRTVFPNSYHGFCAYHIEGNLKSKYKFKDRKKDAFLMGFYIAAKAFVFSEFEKHMDKLRLIHLDAVNYLENEVGFHRWARCHFPVRRYDIMTTNIAESMNALLKDARNLPITALADWIRSVLQRWFYERREEAAKYDEDTLTGAASDKVKVEDCTSLTLSVYSVFQFEFEVRGRGEIVVVDLNSKTCQCRRFNLQQLPCAHAMAAIRYVRGQYGDFCSKYYKNGTLLAAYAPEIHPVGDPRFWEVPNEVQTIVVKPPIGRVPSGRPRNTRIPSSGEEVAVRRCSRCKQHGHNRATCRNPLNSNEN